MRQLPLALEGAYQPCSVEWVSSLKEGDYVLKIRLIHKRELCRHDVLAEIGEWPWIYTSELLVITRKDERGIILTSPYYKGSKGTFPNSGVASKTSGYIWLAPKDWKPNLEFLNIDGGG